LRAYGFDTFQIIIKSFDQIDKLLSSVDGLINGSNCQVIVKKGLGSVLSTMCSFDADNLSMLSSLLEISFYQLMVTFLAMFGVSFGCCYRYYLLNYQDMQVQDIDKVEEEEAKYVDYSK